MAPNKVRKYESLDVVTVGAGAAGIGIGTVLSDLNLSPYTILERDEVGASFRQWPEEMQFITPSFPSNSFGCRDLNAITTDTSPAFALDREHPTGAEYAEYLQGVVEFHELPVRTGVEVEAVEQHNDEFVLHTSAGVIHCRFVVWATGQFGTPNDNPIPGATQCVHNSHVDSWREYVTECISDTIVIVGGYESGIDAALHLADLGYEVIVLDKEGPWQFREPDPSETLSPYTIQRLHEAIDNSAAITLYDGFCVDRIEQSDGGFEVVGMDGESFETRNRSVLATGFESGLGPADEYFDVTEGNPQLTERDESTATPGLFLV